MTVPPTQLSGHSTPRPIRHALFTTVWWFGLLFVCYLLLLGPLCALERRGALRIPEVLDAAVWAPADVLLNTPGAGRILSAYFHLWYADPNGPC
jgi:hypothetical protein